MAHTGTPTGATRRGRGPVVAVVAVLAVAALVLTVAGVAALLRRSGDEAVNDPPIGTAPMDLSHGLRAYVGPDRELHMGGRTFPAGTLADLGDRALPTSSGVVHFRGARPFLLGADGTSRPLWDGASDPGFRSTARWDPAVGVVAFIVRSGSRLVLVVRDLLEAAAITLPVRCGSAPGCTGLVVDAVDNGSVFVRTQRGTFLWDYTGGGGLRPFAGPRTRVADVRNGAVLYAGPRPTGAPDGWTLVAGRLDSQLTFDGAYVLSHSADLQPVLVGGEAVHLDVPDEARSVDVDTDGSVLAATSGSPAEIYDCDLPEGTCEEIGRGRPVFMGGDG